MLKVICLDLDGVFFHKAHTGIVDLLVEKFGFTPEYIKDVLFVRAVTEGGYNEMKLGQIPSQRYWDWFINALGLQGKYSKEQYLIDLHSCYTINTAAAELISKLHQQGLKTALCSNNYEDNIIELKKEFDLDSYFDIQVYSYELGVMKPDVRIYQELAKRANVALSEVWICDDKQENLTSAQALGVKTHLYSDFASLLLDLKDNGIAV